MIDEVLTLEVLSAQGLRVQVLRIKALKVEPPREYNRGGLAVVQVRGAAEKGDQGRRRSCESRCEEAGVE